MASKAALADYKRLYESTVPTDNVSEDNRVDSDLLDSIRWAQQRRSSTGAALPTPYRHSMVDGISVEKFAADFTRMFKSDLRPPSRSPQVRRTLPKMPVSTEKLQVSHTNRERSASTPFVTITDADGAALKVDTAIMRSKSGSFDATKRQ